MVFHHRAFENIGFAYKFGGKAAVGEVIHIAGRAHLLQLAFRHNRHAGGHGHGFFLVVRDHNAGYAHLLERVDQFELGLLAQFFIERTQRLVEQQDFRALGQAARQRHALLLAAGELVRFAFGEFAHLHQSQHFFHARIDFALGHFVLLEAERDVLLHRHMRKQRIALKHHIDGAVIRRQAGDVLAIENDFALIGRFHAGKHTQQRGFAAARAAQKGEDFVLLDIEVDMIDSIVVTKFFHQPLNLQIGLGGRCSVGGHGQCSNE